MESIKFGNSAGFVGMVLAHESVRSNFILRFCIINKISSFFSKERALDTKKLKMIKRTC